jgi:hypothetical protein
MQIWRRFCPVWSSLARGGAGATAEAMAMRSALRPEPVGGLKRKEKGKEAYGQMDGYLTLAAKRSQRDEN